MQFPKTTNRTILLPALIVGLCLISAPVRAEIVHETGSLLEFFAGNEPRCAYDNWVSHMSEGIARPGYNDYGPPELDRQTNGFGRYQIIDSLPDPNKILSDWYLIFCHILAGRIAQADSVLQASAFAAKFEIVELEDGNKNFIIIREHLNNDYFDDNGTPSETDDVRGSFDYGWGIYIFDNSAETPQFFLEAPHPCDDFITPAICINAFFLIGARGLFVNGAGREVVWDQDSIFDNSKTLSDPTRYPVHSAFQQAHKAACDSINDEFILQVHSYDTSNRLYQTCLLSTFEDTMPNPPVMDRGKHFDILSLTPTYPVPANSIGGFQHDACRVDTFYACKNYGASYYTREDSVYIYYKVAAELSGWPSPQRDYSHLRHNMLKDNETWLHVEHDELPNMINVTEKDYYKYDGNVPTYHNYQNAVDFYHPMYQAIHDYFHYTPKCYTVPDDFATIQEAVNHCYDTDTVLVKPGAYHENITFNNHNVVLASLFARTNDRTFIDSTILNGNLDPVITFDSNETAAAQVIGFRITNGFSQNGGGFIIDGASPTIDHCVIVSNSAQTSGGGVYCSGGHPRFVNCTFSRNYANTSGGACFAKDSSNVTFTNCLMWDDDPQEIYIGKGVKPCSLAVGYCDIAGGEFDLHTNNGDWVTWGEEVIDANPRFIDPVKGDFHPAFGSPVINSGNPDSPLDSDSSRADIGALVAMEVSVQAEAGNLPKVFSFDPAYPNPFNPATTIKFGLPKDVEVSVLLYDSNGRTVRTLIVGHYRAGYYTLSLDASPLAAGTYFAKITAGTYIQTRKLVLVK